MADSPTRSGTELWFRKNPASIITAQTWADMRDDGLTEWGVQQLVDHFVSLGMPRITRATFEHWVKVHKLRSRKVKPALGKGPRREAQTLLERVKTDEEHLVIERKRDKTSQKAREQAAVIKALKKEVAEHETRLALYDDLVNAPSSEPYAIRALKGQGKSLPAGTYVMPATDWHMGENVRPEAIQWRNEFNPDIASERAEQFWDSNVTMLNSARSAWDIRQGVLWLGGDLMTGYIHEEYQEDNYLSPTQEAYLVFETMILGIDHLLAVSDLEHILIPTSHGNHSRTNPKRRISTAAMNSYEHLIFRLLARHYKDEDRLTFQIADGYNNIVDLYGYQIRFHHGDALKYGGGVGGISVPMLRRIGRQATGDLVPVDLDVIGHFHELQNPRRFVVNGSLIGWNAYAEEIGCSFQEPLQCSFVIDEKYHLLNNFNPIVVQRRRK